jgi:hypothetical protein
MRDKKAKRDLEIANRNSEIDKECALCLAEVKPDDLITSLPCGHRFHTKCIHRSIRARFLNCPACTTAIPTDYYPSQTMTYEEAQVAKSRAQEDSRLARQIYDNARERTEKYERSTKSQRLSGRGVNSPTYFRLLQAEDTADADVIRTQEDVKRYTDIIRKLSNN